MIIYNDNILQYKLYLHNLNMFSIKHSSISSCKLFFKQFNTIIDHTACIINPYGFHVHSSNRKFGIFAILDNETFNHFICPKEVILQMSIKNINNMFSKHDTYHSLSIHYNGNNSILFTINKNSTYSISCSLITNKKYIENIKNVDDVDYHVEFEVQPKYIYSILKKIIDTKDENDSQNDNKNDIRATNITIRADPDTQNIYIDTIKLNDSSLDTYHFVTPIQQVFCVDYVYQFIKNTLKNKYTSIEIGLYKNKSMKLQLYTNDYNYIELYIPPLKS